MKLEIELSEAQVANLRTYVNDPYYDDNSTSYVLPAVVASARKHPAFQELEVGRTYYSNGTAKTIVAVCYGMVFYTANGTANMLSERHFKEFFIQD